MKDKIHPPYYPAAKIRCACGKIYTIGSAREKMAVEICGNCHPFYTGKDKLIDIAGRVEKFRSRQERAKAKPKQTVRKTVNKKTESNSPRLQKVEVKKKAKK